MMLKGYLHTVRIRGELAGLKVNEKNCQQKATNFATADPPLIMDKLLRQMKQKYPKLLFCLCTKLRTLNQRENEITPFIFIFSLTHE
jgi:hypothetical protein